MNEIIIKENGEPIMKYNDNVLFRSLNIGWYEYSGVLFSIESGSKVCNSVDGQYIAYVGDNGTYISSEYGTGFTSEMSGGNDIDMSYTGQYVSMIDNGGIHLSNDYGYNWWQVTGTTVNAGNCISISQTGQYQIAGEQNSGNSKIKVSNDFGQTWTDTAQYYTYNATSVAVSGDGQYMIMTRWQSLIIKRSDDYGVTWTDVNLSTDIPANPQTTSSSISQTGQYMIITSYGYDAPWHRAQVNISSDYGVTWTYNNEIIVSGYFYSCDLSSNGEIMIIGNHDAVYISSDYGVTWKQEIDPILYGGTIVAVSGDGNYYVGGTYDGLILANQEKVTIGKRF